MSEASSPGLSDVHVLASPIEATVVRRMLVIGGPLGLLVAIIFSLWMSNERVTNSVIVQTDRSWPSGGTVAVRAQLLDGERAGVDGVRTDVAIRSPDGSATVIGELTSAPKGGVAQGQITVPERDPGPAAVQFRFAPQHGEPIEEWLSLDIVRGSFSRTPVHSIAASTLQWADDSDAQLENVHIVVRASDRLLAGFDNVLFVRVTQPDGRPWIGAVEVVLIDGEFMERRGANNDPPRLFMGTTDHLGLVRLSGPLTSEVLRVEVRLLSAEEPRHMISKRRLRMVSYAGAVQVRAWPSAVYPGQSAKVAARGLSQRRPVFVDMFTPSGAWTHTITPPFVGPQPYREVAVPNSGGGFLQFEAYHYTNDPGESTALARVQVLDEGVDPQTLASLAPLIAAHRAKLDLARVERDFDPDHERAYLNALEKLELTADDVEIARAWLLGTAPVEIYGPTTVLNTRAREENDLAQRQRFWTLVVRWYLLGGGAVFLAMLAGLMIRSHARGAETTLRGINEHADQVDADHLASLRDEVGRARRAATLRGFGVLAIMAVALVMTVVMLENFVWDL